MLAVCTAVHFVRIIISHISMYVAIRGIQTDFDRSERSTLSNYLEDRPSAYGFVLNPVIDRFVEK